MVVNSQQIGWLRRPKTQIHYVSTSPEDLQAILETIALATGDNEN